MNKKISRKDFLKNNALTWGGLSLGLGGPCNFDIKSFLLEGNIKKESALPDDSGIRRGSWVRKDNKKAGDVILAAADKGCQIVVAIEEHSAVQQAAKFLADDIEKISGYRPSLVTKSDDNYVSIHITTIVNSNLPETISHQELKDQWESFKIITTGNNVWLIGSDFRGAAFAVYTLSERLGIDPLYIWTNYAPEFHGTLILKKTDFTQNPPTIKYRGFFHDDEDILPRPYDENDYPYRFGDVSLEWYKRYFETALRLRMNIVAPYTRVHRRYEVQKCASDWGLFYTSHHYDILLSNPFGIERFNLAEKRGVTADWDWFNNKENMLKYWSAGVEENKNLSAIWPVGLRGTDDHAYKFPPNISAQQQANVFSQVLKEQVKIVKDIIPTDHPILFHFTLYTEMLDKYENNEIAFNVPENVIIVWPDDNDGSMRNLPKQLGKWKHGVYYHLAYYGGDNSKQSIHTVSPERIAKQFQNITKSGATEFLLINVSEMREFIMEARMIADISWEASSMLDSDNPAKKYIEWWANEYFGKDTYDKVTEIYQQYYELLSTPLLSRFGTTMIEDLLDKLSKKFKNELYEKLDETKVALLNKRTNKYNSLLSLISNTSRKMSNQQKQFLFENVELPLLLDFRPTQAAHFLVTAVSDAENKTATDLLEEAIKPLEQLEIEILRAERPPFENWYRPTWIRAASSPLNVHRAYDQLKDFITSNKKVSPIKPKEKAGHQIEQAKVWSKFLDDMEKLNLK